MFKKKTEAKPVEFIEKIEEIEVDDEEEEIVDAEEEPTPKKVSKKETKKVEAPKLNLTADEVVAGIEFNINRAMQLLQLLK